MSETGTIAAMSAFSSICAPSGSTAPDPIVPRVTKTIVRALDSYATLLVLLLANFFLLELVDDPRWGAIGSTLLAAGALIVAISDPEAGHHIGLRHWLEVAACVALAPLVLLVNSTELIGLTYLLPVALLVTATLPVTLNRILHHKR